MESKCDLNVLHRNMFSISKRSFASHGTPKFNVAVLGAAGGIGQPLSLLLKQSPLINKLSLFDLVNTPGMYL